MEFIGNRVNAKELAVICIAAFFAGRIQIFEGTFPAAPAFIIVMLAVSTVYIYLLPFIVGAMALYGHQGIFFYGDMIAVIFVALFFLFFHKKKFSIYQRCTIGAVAIIACNLVAYAWADMMHFLQLDVLLKKIIAFYIYMRIYNTVCKVVYVGRPSCEFSRERILFSLMGLVISMSGAIGVYEMTFAFWTFLIAAILYNRGLQEAFSFAGMAAVYSFCMGETLWQLYACLFTGVVIAWYGATFIETAYRKTLTGIVLFLVLSGSGGAFVYCVGIAMAMFIAIPVAEFSRWAFLVEERFMPEVSTAKALQHLAIEKNLQKKKEAFLTLGQLYDKEFAGKQIFSYQFMGMARTIERLQRDLGVRPEFSTERRLLKVSVGQASYSFDKISGDSMEAFAVDGQRVALIISDGMGKGAAAAVESKMVVSTLSWLLRAGFDVDLAMKTINGILMSGNQDERFATVDLALIDRAKGRAKIYKMGAATTFIRHDGRVSMLKRQALPAGITSGLDLEYIDISLKRGDLLVMVSDGVTDCDRKDYNCDWLRSRLLEIGSRDPETIAELIVNKAAEKYGIHERDDLSVMTASIGV